MNAAERAEHERELRRLELNIRLEGLERQGKLRRWRNDDVCRVIDGRLRVCSNPNCSCENGPNTRHRQASKGELRYTPPRSLAANGWRIV